MTRRYPYSLGFALLTLLAAGTLAFGAVYPYGILLLQLGAIAITATLVLRARNHRHWPSLDATLYPLLFPGAVVLLQVLANRTAFWQASLEETLLWAAYLLIFLCAFQLLQKPEETAHALPALTAFGAAVALFALVQNAVSNGKIYWLHTPLDGSSVIFGPYVNRNHYAGMIGMLLPFALAGAASRTRSLAFRGWMGAAAVTMLVSLGASGSRGGATACAIVLILWGSLLRPRHKRGWAIAAATLSVAVFMLVAYMRWDDQTIVHQPGGSSMGLFSTNRLETDRDALRMIVAHPWTGFGLNTFPEVYPAHATSTQRFVMNELHNDWLQIFVELGIPAGLAAIAFLGLVLSRAYGVIQHEREHERLREWRMGAALAVCGFAVHGLFDFNLHVPANAAWFFACCAWAGRPGVRVLEVAPLREGRSKVTPSRQPVML
jgi:O-antigen ligase